MATFDVRNSGNEGITEIVFADEEDTQGFVQAYRLNFGCFREDNPIAIDDGENCVIINTKEHAENLIKALRKAIELGWIE